MDHSLNSSRQPSLPSPALPSASEENLSDDDIDFQPATEESDELEYFETADDAGEEEDNEEEETEGELHDGGGDEEELELEFSIRPADDSNGETGTAHVGVTQPSGTTGHLQVSRAQILHLLGHTGLRRLLAQQGIFTASPQDADNDDGDGNEEEEDDDDDGDGSAFGLYGRRRRPRRSRKGTQPKYPPVPNPEGTKLMGSGTFGQSQNFQDRLRRRKRRVSRMLMERELGLNADQARRKNKETSQNMIPPSQADYIIHYNSRCYSGQFSDDGNFFFSCAQDFKVRMYDTSNPYEWRYYKTVVYPYGQWTITDATLSPDNRYLAYSSIRSSVCLAVTDPADSSEPWMLDFADLGDPARRGRGFYGNTHFGIWSIRFSGDGRELVAGTSDSSVYVFNIEANRSILRIPGHSDDVNAVCFGDVSSPHILYSGSDDTLIKVWDRRSMGDSREAGVFLGHTEGLTYVDGRGDGRYVLSNGKDQTMKLWDLRRMLSTEQSAKIDPSDYSTAFDYRYQTPSTMTYKTHPHDCSLVTYRGHSVLKTLIRCHFSPAGSTNSRYVYSGSEDGKIHIYNLDATLAGKIDVTSATMETRPRNSGIYMNAWEDSHSRHNWKTCVRDASWHPNAPVMAATSWNGYGMSTGTCTIHSWKDGSADDETEKMAVRVNHKLEPDPAYYDGSSGRRPTRTGLRSRTAARVALDSDDDPDW